jgi:hypothetical protein
MEVGASNCLPSPCAVPNSSSQIKFLRKSYGSRLNVFAPINDLSSLSKTNWEDRTLVPGKKNDVAIAGGQILGDEYSTHVVKVASISTFLCFNH